MTSPRELSPTVNFRITTLTILLALCFFAQESLTLLHAQRMSAGNARFQPAQPLAMQPTGKNAAAFEAQQARPLAMTSADLDEDGIADLVVGYSTGNSGAIAVMRGNLDALAPTSFESWQAAGQGHFAAPFLPQAQMISVPEHPDLIAVADVNGDGHADLVFAARNGHALYLLTGDGRGHFTPQPPVLLAGAITALATYRPGDDSTSDVVIVGLKTTSGYTAALLRSTRSGFVQLASYALPGPVTAIQIANLSAGFTPDAAILSGGQLIVLHGEHALTGAARLETLPLSNVVAITVGQFLFDRHAQTQLSAITADGTLHLLAHQGFDPHTYSSAEIASARRDAQKHSGTQSLTQKAGNTGDQPWTVVETFAGVAPSGSISSAPILLHAKASGSGDDIVVLNPSQQEILSIHHPATQSNPQANLRHSPLTSGTVLAALSQRVSPLGGDGLVMLRQGSIHPEIVTPAAGNVLYVNTATDNFQVTTLDPNDAARCTQGSAEICTLRDAIAYANLDSNANLAAATVDTIMVPAGDYILTAGVHQLDANGNAITHFNILGPMTILGVAGSTTINANNNDKIFSINPNFDTVFNVTLSNLLLENGQNANNPATAPNGGITDNFGGTLDWEALGTGNLTITSSTIFNSIALWGPGGGIFASNTPGGAGLLTITNSTISNGQTPEEGGGVYLGFGAAAAISGSTFAGNAALVSHNTNDPGAIGQGGGIFLSQRGTSATPQSTIQAGSFTSNSSDSDGAGIYTNTGVAIAGGTTFTSNYSTSGSGGGIFHDTANSGFPETTTIAGANFESNAAANAGGAIAVGAGTAAAGNLLTIANSRIFTVATAASGGANGISVGEPGTSGAGGVTATDNWWGCNLGPTTPGDNCAQAALYDATTGYLTTSPYIVLSFAVSPNPVLPNQPLQLLATVNKDSNGAAVPNSPGALASLNVAFAVNAVSFTASPAALIDSSGNATQSVTPTNVGLGTATASLDNQIVGATFTVGLTPAAPTFTPPAGTYNNAQTVTITDANPGTTIYYTTNGTAPTAASTLYSGPVAIGVTETLKAIAVESGFNNSAVTSANYVIQIPAATPVLSVAPGTYTAPQLMTMSDATHNCAIYYTTDGSTPTTASTRYVQQFGFSTSETINAICIAPNFAPSAVATAAYIFNLTPAATPTFFPAAGVYTTTQSVTLSDATVGSTIYYTTNGTTPTSASTKYTGAIPVTATTTIKAFAVNAAHLNSAVGSALYAIEAQAAAPVLSVAPGTYTAPQLMSITEATHNSAVYYTTNGTTPTTASTRYVQAFAISTSQTFKAIAVAPNFVNSPVTSAVYVINLPPAATPVFTPAAGTYTAAQNVTITDGTAGASIYYTTDGSTPTTASTKYTAAIPISATETLKAIAVQSSHSTSALASGLYAIDYPAAAPVFSVAPGTYTSAQLMTMSSTTHNSAIYYTTDGTTPTTASTRYTQAFGFSTTGTLKAIAIAPLYSTSPVASAAYIFNLPPAATPVISPNGGTFAAAQNVTITDGTAGATLYYTTDGSTPTTASTKYTGAISVTATETINVIAVAAGKSNSAVASAAFTIN